MRIMFLMTVTLLMLIKKVVDVSTVYVLIFPESDLDFHGLCRPPFHPRHLPCQVIERVDRLFG